MDIGDLKKAIADMPDRTQVMTTDVENQVWSVLRSNIGLLEDGELIFVISRYVKPSNTQVKGSVP